MLQPDMPMNPVANLVHIFQKMANALVIKQVHISSRKPKDTKQQLELAEA